MYSQTEINFMHKNLEDEVIRFKQFGGVLQCRENLKIILTLLDKTDFLEKIENNDLQNVVFSQMLSLNEFSKYLSATNCGQKKANEYLRKNPPVNPFSINVSKQSLESFLQTQKKTRFDQQSSAFERAWDIVNVFKNNENCVNGVCERVRSVDDYLNYGELIDFFTFFKYLKVCTQSGLINCDDETCVDSSENVVLSVTEDTGADLDEPVAAEQAESTTAEESETAATEESEAVAAEESEAVAAEESEAVSAEQGESGTAEESEAVAAEESEAVAAEEDEPAAVEETETAAAEQATEESDKAI